MTPALIRPLDRLAVRNDRLRTFISELHAASQAYQDHKLSVLLGMFMALPNQTLVSLSFASVAASLLPHPPTLAQHLQVVPLIIFSTAMPLPFSALGFSEEISENLFHMIGHSMGRLAMLGFRLIGLAIGCISFSVYAASTREFGRLAIPDP